MNILVVLCSLLLAIAEAKFYLSKKRHSRATDSACGSDGEAVLSTSKNMKRLAKFIDSVGVRSVFVLGNKDRKLRSMKLTSWSKVVTSKPHSANSDTKFYVLCHKEAKSTRRSKTVKRAVRSGRVKFI